MLDVSLRQLSFRYPKSGFEIRDISVTFAASTFTAVTGPTGCGSSTLLRLIAGQLKPSSGDLIAGSRNVTAMVASRRPLLYVAGSLEVPGRWSVRHALVNAVRNRSLDRTDRLHEIALAIEKWDLERFVDRRVDSLSSGESARLHTARIELQKPAILIADRLLEGHPPAGRRALADELYRTLRVLGTTVIGAPVDLLELGFTDRVVVLDDGRLVQHASAAEVFASPLSQAAALASGDVNVIPITIRGGTIESAIGSWELANPPFSGDGVALARPGDFHAAAAGEESDFIFGIEEATFDAGRWIARGLLTGGNVLRVVLPPGIHVDKGRLMALRYDPEAFTLLPGSGSPASSASGGRLPSGVVPSIRDSR